MLFLKKKKFEWRAFIVTALKQYNKNFKMPLNGTAKTLKALKDVIKTHFK